MCLVGVVPSVCVCVCARACRAKGRESRGGGKRETEWVFLIEVALGERESARAREDGVVGRGGTRCVYVCVCVCVCVCARASEDGVVGRGGTRSKVE